MLSPLIRSPRRSAEPPSADPRSNERGFTMVLVTVSLVAVIAMAALSIDVGTLYQAKAEAQRAADAAALTAARVISISGITGDPNNGSSDGSWSAICGGGGSAATLSAISVAQQNLINGAAVPAANVTVNYGVGTAGASSATCVGLGAGFGVNPVITVKVQSAKLPTFFARVFSLIPGGTSSNSGVSATATAEVFNPSDSGTLAGTVIPVQPRCVKPWIVPNADPKNPGKRFVHLGSAAIESPGISQLAGGVIGESFNLSADCNSPGTPGACTLINPTPSATTGTPGTLQYIPALISGTPAAVPSCSLNPGFQSDIAGCDTTTVYACGTANGAQYDLTENPVNPSGASGDTSTAVECLINNSAGRDVLANPGAITFPFQIQAGFGNPLVHAGVVNNGDTITTSNSIVTIPIFNSNANPATPLPPQITIVGFLQVFINQIDAAGNINVTVLNVAGCSDDATSASVFGTSPVPIRLITKP